MLVAGPVSGTSASARRHGLRTGCPYSTLLSECPRNGAASVRYRTQAARRGRCGGMATGGHGITFSGTSRHRADLRASRRQDPSPLCSSARPRRQRVSRMPRESSTTQVTGRGIHGPGADARAAPACPMGIGPRAVHACASPAWRSCVCWPRKGSVGVAGSAATRGGAGFGNEPGRANQEGAPGRGRWTRQGHRCAPHRPGSHAPLVRWPARAATSVRHRTWRAS